MGTIDIDYTSLGVGLLLLLFTSCGVSKRDY